MATARIPGQQRSAEREVVEICNRTTKGGMTEASRKLRYKLKVMQQPERARACGSGAKSSADRRPVDPPPVVELKIFDVDENGQEHDITFGYKANFFLFATLEMARPMAHGRVQPAAQAIPVLTGMPVSGMAYLDRPSEAGYFIFPDLSVRHEGKYKLSFNLYEQTKLDDDTDLEPATEHNKPKMPVGNDPDSSFDWRLEVKSDMFTVYSAKKFPGLAESTTLSRTVAEQGCRVRIRRDVRMRRRETKAGEFEDELSSEHAYSRGRMQDDYERERSRSLSNSPERSTPNGGWASNETPQGGHLNWMGGGPQAPNNFAAPPPPPPPMAPRQQPFAPGPYPPGPPTYQTAPHSGPQAYGYPHPQSAHPTYGQRGEYLEHDADPRRYSVPGPPRPYGMDTYSSQPRFQNHPPQSPHPPHLPPLRLAPVGSKYDGPISPHEPLSRIAPESPLYERHDRPYSQYPAIQAAPAPPQAGLKRDFGNAFTGAEARLSERLHDGMRPSSSHQNHADDDDDAGMRHVMIYKRAAGNQQTREVPAEEE